MTEPSSYAIAILLGIQSKLQRGEHVYEGTVPASVIARRRARNKVARLSRRANRGS